MDGVYRMYEKNKNIFGGFSPLELINMQDRNRGRTRQHIAVDTAVRNLGIGEGSVDHLESLIKGYGPHSKNLVSQFQNWREEYLRKHHINSAKDMQKYRQAAHDQALNILGANQKKQGRRAAVEITLSPDAKKWFDILTKDTGQTDTPGRNAMSSFWRKANHFATNNFGGSLGGIGGEIGGALDDVVGGGLVESGLNSSGLNSLF
jgi:hypothetical protein